MRELLERVCARDDLSRAQAQMVFEDIIAGRQSEIDITAWLIALKTKGETPDELAGAATALLAAAVPFERPAYAYADTCGTGGDGAQSLNVSTAVAIVAAELGVPVAKHGNRSVSSRSGSADVLEAIGVRIDASPDEARAQLDSIGLCFMFAPHYHAGVRHAMPVRRALRLRTLFNLLGPIINPSRPPWQLMGVYDPTLCVPVARTLALLGSERALVVHGDGLDEVALHGETRCALLRDGDVVEVVIVPEEAGLKRRSKDELVGGEPAQNAAAMIAVLQGAGNDAYRDAVALNAGALLWATGRAANIAEGTSEALDVLESRRAFDRLMRWKEISRGAR